jgi:hypothetical protein
VILFFLLLYIPLGAALVYWDAPNLYPQYFEAFFLMRWNNTDSMENIIPFFARGLVVLIVGFFLSLLFGSTGGLANGLIGGLIGVLIGGLTGVLVGVFAFSSVGVLAGGFSVVFAGGLAGGFSGVFAGSLAGGLAFGLVVGLSGGLIFGLSGGLAGILAFTISFVLLFTRLPFWLYYFLFAQQQVTLSKNPYCKDAVIWFPLPSTDEQLLKESHTNPPLAFEFITFLLQHRPFQRTFAAQLTHAATAGSWLQKNFPDTPLLAPKIPANTPDYHPAEPWLQALNRLDKQLTKYKQESAGRLKLLALQNLKTLSDELHTQTLRESPRWHRFYLKTFEVLNIQIEQELQAQHDKTHRP